MQYFIIINDVQQGPFSLEELRARHITSDTLVWAEGMAQWMPAWQVDELKPLIYGQPANSQTPPPPPPVQNQTHEEPYERQTATQPDYAGTTPPPLQSEGHSSHRVWAWIGGAVVALLLIMAMTNPSKDEHQQAISYNLVQGFAKGVSTGEEGSFFGAGLLGTVAGPFIDGTLNALLQYHNYVFWSTTTIEIPGSGVHRTSLGIFGKVFTVDEEDVAKAVSKAFGQQGSSVVRSVTFGGGNDDDGSDNGESSNASTSSQTDSTDLGTQIGHTVINKVSQHVKKEIAQQADSAEAEGIGKIIDEISRFLKGL